MQSFAPGDLVKVRLSVEVPETTYYLILEDRLPAGFEALNESLNNTAYDVDREELYGDYYLFGEESWQNLGYNYKEIRDGRVSFFFTRLRCGKTHFLLYGAGAIPRRVHHAASRILGDVFAIGLGQVGKR